MAKRVRFLRLRCREWVLRIGSLGLGPRYIRLGEKGLGCRHSG